MDFLKISRECYITFIATQSEIKAVSFVLELLLIDALLVLDFRVVS